MFLKYMALGAMTSLVLAASQVFAFEASFSDLKTWLSQHADAPTDGLAPAIYRQDQSSELAPYLAPGVKEQFDFPELQFEVTETQHYVPHQSYADATAKHIDKATIRDDGLLQGYVAGQPFSTDAIEKAPVGQAGQMVAWNQIHRWQYYGYRMKESVMAYILATPDGSSGELIHGMEGGGHADRHVTVSYHRVYLSGLSHLPEQDYRMDVSGGGELLYKEHLEILEPFDVAGMQFVIERPLDQTLGDQVNSYLPSERRVRRLSAKERADSFMGTVWTMDDFEGFSGLVTDNTWTLIGHKVVPHVTNARHDLIRLHGPMSVVALDRWQLRSCYVVEAIPKWEGHRYGRRVMFIDRETFTIVTTLIYDRNDDLLKIFHIAHSSPDTQPTSHPSLTVPMWRASIGLNVQEKIATVAWAMKPTEFLTMKPSKVRQLFSVSNLTSGR